MWFVSGSLGSIWCLCGWVCVYIVVFMVVAWVGFVVVGVGLVDFFFFVVGCGGGGGGCGCGCGCDGCV